jgi:hypothetical protein
VGVVFDPAFFPVFSQYPVLLDILVYPVFAVVSHLAVPTLEVIGWMISRKRYPAGEEFFGEIPKLGDVFAHRLDWPALLGPPEKRNGRARVDDPHLLLVDLEKFRDALLCRSLLGDVLPMTWIPSTAPLLMTGANDISITAITAVILPDMSLQALCMDSSQVPVHASLTDCMDSG